MQLCGRIFKKMPPIPFCPHPAPKSLYKGESLLLQKCQCHDDDDWWWWNLDVFFCISLHWNDHREYEWTKPWVLPRGAGLVFYLYLCVYSFIFVFVFHRNDRQGYAVAKPWLLPRGRGRRRSPPSSLQGDTGQEKLSAVITCHLMSSHIHVIIFKRHLYSSYVILSSIILYNINLSISQSCY